MADIYTDNKNDLKLEEIREKNTIGRDNGYNPIRDRDARIYDIEFFERETYNIFALRNMLNMEKLQILEGMNLQQINNLILKFSFQNSFNPSLIRVEENKGKVKINVNLEAI